MTEDEKITFLNDLIEKLREDDKLRKMVSHALKHTLMPWEISESRKQANRRNLIGDVEIRRNSVKMITSLDMASGDDIARDRGYILLNW
jgi:hypothetical protein